jgi:MFS family permease
LSATTARRPSLFRHPDFVKLWSAATISLFGTQVSQIAIPVIAVVILDVPAWQVALLGTLEFLPFLLFTLPAGVWVDRVPRRRILISGDLGRAVMLATIPIAYALNALTIWQLYVVAFVNGIFTVFFDIADQSYLPTVVDRSQLVDANGKLQASVSTAQVVGQPLGGGMVGLLSAPIAVILDAVSYAVSAFLVFLIRRKEHVTNARASAAGPAAEVAADSPASGTSVAAEASVSPSGTTERPGLRQEISEGLRYVVGHRYLRNIAATTGSSNFFSNIAFAIFPVFVLRDLALTPAAFGLIGGAFGVGSLVGAVTAGRVAERFRIGPTIVAAILIGSVPQLLVPLSTHDTAVLLIGGSGLFSGWSNMVYNINQVSLRQSITPERMLGRMNATMRFIVWGTIPIGQIVGGVIATAFGTVTAIWVGVIGGLFVFLPVFFSPVRTLERIPEPDPEGPAAARRGDMPNPEAPPA